MELVGTLCNRAHPKMLMEDARLRARVARQLKGINNCMFSFLLAPDIKFYYKVRLLPVAILDLVVRTTHLETQRFFCIFGMTAATADKYITLSSFCLIC